MKHLTYTGPEGSHYPTLRHEVDGEIVRGLVPVVGESYALVEDEPDELDDAGNVLAHGAVNIPTDGNWAGSRSRAAREVAVKHEVAEAPVE